MDCGGIGLLIACREETLRQGVTWRLVGARGSVRQMLTLSDLMREAAEQPARCGESFSGCDAPLTLPA